ncbi:MAG: metalloregulator ArsR/SmtB family transcription factor [Holophagales bacterium]|nr:metalloregulator ArsR/SmtB family transcription factor [Holophagales bacterium]
MDDELEPVWKALADRTRRQILSLLRRGPLPTNEIVTALPHLSRFGIMKHLSVLRDAGLVTARKEGTRRLNSLNVVPIRRVYEELVDEYQDLWATRLLRLGRELESHGRGSDRDPHDTPNPEDPVPGDINTKETDP